MPVPCCLALADTHSMLTSYPKEPETVFWGDTTHVVRALLKRGTCNSIESLVLGGNDISNRKIAHRSSLNSYLNCLHGLKCYSSLETDL